MELKFFKLDDFRCPCGRAACDAPKMDMNTILKLEGLRREFGEPMIVTSGSRCSFHNKAVGGSEKSQHMLGYAVDISCPDGSYLYRLIALAIKHGFTIGVKSRMLHLDTRPGRPVAFAYN